MRWMLVPAIYRILAVLTLLTGLALLALAQWGRPLVQAAEAAGAGEIDRAMAGYAQSEQRFTKLEVAKTLLTGAHDASVANQLALQYRTGRYDDLIEKAATAQSTADTHFWSGCAFFAKGKDEQQNDARLGWLGRAEQEFRRALELDPGDWNTKYNYELTRKLLDELRKQPKTPPKQLLNLLRPQPKAGGQPARRIG